MEIKIENEIIIPQGEENIVLEAGDVIVVKEAEEENELKEGLISDGRNAITKVLDEINDYAFRMQSAGANLLDVLKAPNTVVDPQYQRFVDEAAREFKEAQKKLFL